MDRGIPSNAPAPRSALLHGASSQAREQLFNALQELHMDGELPEGTLQHTFDLVVAGDAETLAFAESVGCPPTLLAPFRSPTSLGSTDSFAGH